MSKRDRERRPALLQTGTGSGRPGHRKNATQAPDRGRHPRGCRPRRRFCGATGCRKWPHICRRGRRFSTCGESRPEVIHVQVENLHPREGNELHACRKWPQVSRQEKGVSHQIWVLTLFCAREPVTADGRRVGDPIAWRFAFVLRRATRQSLRSTEECRCAPHPRGRDGRSGRSRG